MAATNSVSDNATDTIVAISTPPGRGGIGIVRLSGPQAAAIAAQLVRPRQTLEHARARLADVVDIQEAAGATNEAAGAVQSAGDAGDPRTDFRIIDEALVTFFGAPNSYTA